MAKILLLLCLPTLINAWREWPHYGEGGSKWKRNWLSRENQNVSYWGGKVHLLYSFYINFPSNFDTMVICLVF